MTLEQPVGRFSSKSEAIRHYLRQGITDVQQLIDITGSSKSAVYRVKKQVKEVGFPIKEVGDAPQIIDEREDTSKVQFTFKPITETPDIEGTVEALEKEVKKVIFEGEVTKDQLTAIFDMTNTLLLNSYHKDATNKLMGATGTPVINRLGEKYSVENLDVIIFAGLMILYFGAPLKPKFEEWNNRRRGTSEVKRQIPKAENQD